MTVVTYAWELGGGLGHAVSAAALGEAFHSRGHEIAYVVKDVTAADRAIGQRSSAILQAPAWPLRQNTDTRPLSYAEILLAHGFGDPVLLARMVRAWHHLFRLLKSELVILDFAPTAWIAARMANIHHCTFGHGFFLPPRQKPIPPFFPSTDQPRLERSEETLLRSINDVCKEFNAPQCASLGEHFRADADFLTTWPELDHYPLRVGGRYLGPILLRQGGGATTRPCPGSPKICGYIYGSYSGLGSVLAALKSSGEDTLLYVPGAPRDTLDRYRSEKIHFCNEPIALHEVLHSASLLICHGNFGTVWEGLLAGKAMLCLPLHMEHYITATQLARLGTSIVAAQDTSETFLAAGIGSLLTQSSYSAAAQRLAEKYKGYDQSNVLARIVDESITGLRKK